MANTKLNEGGITSTLTPAAIVIVFVLVMFAVWYSSTGEKTPEASDNTGIAVRHLALSETDEPNIGIEIGQTAPNFIDINDSSFSLNSHRGNVIVLDFMATECKPCEAEMGHLKELYTDYSNREVIIISIDIDPSESDETIKRFASSYGDDWIFTSGPNVGVKYLAIPGELPGIPTMYIINKQGIIVYRNIGVTNYSTLAAEIKKIL